MSDSIRLDSELVDGKYLLDMELGAGAFGAVYKATQLVLDRPLRQIALKLFKSDVISEENVREQMNDALALIELLSNETDWEVRQHFVTIYDLGVTKDAAPRGYVAMELVRGGNLQKRIDSFGQFTLSGTLHYLRQLLIALAFMHRQGFVHSDLKPENILVFKGRGHDLIKIGDFGLSGRFQQIVGGSGPRGGTQAYLALEALMGANTTPSSDVFSLGLIAYEMLTGTNPYAEIGSGATAAQKGDPDYLGTLHQQARLQQPLKLLRGHFPELMGANPDPILGGMLDLINKMLNATPENRYASADAALLVLEELLGKKSDPEKSAATISSSRQNSASNQSPVRNEAFKTCEPLIAAGQWTAAIEHANHCISESPRSSHGYLLKSEIFQRQAKVFAKEEQERAVVTSVRKQALMPLQKGMRVCKDSESQRELAQELANLYRLLGDDDSARKYLSMGGLHS